MVEKNQKIVDFPVPAIRRTPREKLEDAITAIVAQYCRAVVYTRSYHNARKITIDYNLADLIMKPEETKIEINYTVELNTTAILTGLAMFLDDEQKGEL